MCTLLLKVSQTLLSCFKITGENCIWILFKIFQKWSLDSAWVLYFQWCCSDLLWQNKWRSLQLFPFKSVSGFLQVNSFISPCSCLSFKKIRQVFAVTAARTFTLSSLTVSKCEYVVFSLAAPVFFALLFLSTAADELAVSD